ncbi:UNKNOWN [Stylonychia lemnae]|uniref:Uncharacterized protein n=1 Tax=Stylonychia lemnae TaxID=5949 RepID=A0A078A408_STYLE|nr:UNKNOWN [Stylonychia lemnae]|eukprot:CDW75499.1 UNKNOWN [Stylonychia lemnae]
MLILISIMLVMEIQLNQTKSCMREGNQKIGNKKESLPPIERQHFDREKEFRVRLNSIKKNYQMERLKGDVQNERYKQSSKYIEPIDDDGYRFKREQRVPMMQDVIQHRPKIQTRVIEPPPVIIDPKAAQYHDPLPAYYYNTPYFKEYFTPAHQPMVKLSPLYKSPHPIVQVQREIQMKNDIISGLNTEIKRIKNYDSLYNYTYGNLM